MITHPGMTGSLRRAGFYPWRRLVLLVTLLFSGCATPQVFFTIQENSRVKLTGIQRLAVLDFASTYSGRKVGEAFALDVVDWLRTQGNLQVLSPVETRPVLGRMQLMASAFNDPYVVSEAGKNLGADALLFGDVQTAEVQKSVKRETFTRQTGVRHETVNETGSDGKVHTVTYAYPVMKESWRDHITRTFIFHAEARLVRTRDAGVLWQESSDWSQDAKAEEEENGTRRGDWSLDEEFSSRQMHLAAQHLLAKLLPRVLERVRFLAEAQDEGPYAEWIKTGNQAALAGNWEQGGESWLKAVSLSPSRPEARANLGVFYEHQGDFQQALQDYELAAKQIKKPWGDYARDVKKLLEGK